MTGSNGYQLQPAGIRDLFALRRLENECFPEDAWPLIDLLGALTLPGITRLKAVIDQEMVGFVAGSVKAYEKVGWIMTIGVQAVHRRKGIGLALLQACETHMRAPAVRLCVRRSNQAAIQLYQNTGYAPVDVWARYYYGGEDALVLEKKFLMTSGS